MRHPSCLPLAALVLAVVGDGRAAGAQPSTMTDPHVVAITQAYDIRTGRGVYDFVDQRAYRASSHAAGPGGTDALASADLETVSLKARAIGSTEGVAFATAQSWFHTEVWFLNASLSPVTQGFDAFMHGAIAHRASRTGGYARAKMTLRVFGGATRSLVFEQSAEQGSWETPDGTSTTGKRLGRPLELPIGLSRFTVELGLDTEVRGPWEADYGNTVNLFLPPTAGVTWGMPGTAGTRQYVPTWAQPGPTVVPEPSAVLMLGGGLLLLLGGAVHRRPTGG